MWPSSLLSEMVMRRLEQHRYPHPFQHLAYPAAGHLIRFPYQPTTVTAIRHPIAGKVFAVGGKPAAHALATADSWVQVLAFLHRSLGGETGDG